MLDAQGRAVSPDGSPFPAEKGAGEGKKSRRTSKRTCWWCSSWDGGSGWTQNTVWGETDITWWWIGSGRWGKAHQEWIPAFSFAAKSEWLENLGPSSFLILPWNLILYMLHFIQILSPEINDDFIYSEITQRTEIKNTNRLRICLNTSLYFC